MSKHKAEQTENATPTPAQAPEPLPVPVSETELQDLKDKSAKSQQWSEQLLRTTADFENYKKRALRERQDAAKYANESLLQRLVPVLDNFDSAMSAATAGPGANAQALQAGVTMIHQQFKAALAEAGLEEIDATLKPFDPNFHEAVAQEESAAVAEGHVLRQMRKGYKLRDRLLRPATVVVAKPVTPKEAK